MEAEENGHGKKEYVQVNHCSNSALHGASQGEPLALGLQLDEERGPWLARIGCRIHGGQWDVRQVHEQGDDKAKVDGELESSTRRKELSVEQEDGRFREEEDGREQHRLDEGELEEAPGVKTHRNIPGVAKGIVLYPDEVFRQYC